MASDIKNDIAAAAAAARRREEAARRAEAARKAAEAAALAAKAKAAAQAPKKGFGKDELSTGNGGALRRLATNKLSATGLPTVATALPATAKTFKASDLLNNPKAAATAKVDDSYDSVEQIRAQRAQDTALDNVTKDLPADKAQKVKDAAKATAAVQNGISDPGQRAQATAEEIQRQSEQFKGDPASAGAYAKAIAPQVESIGRDLSGAITTPLHGDSDKNTKPTLQALAKACDNLGAGASMDIGHFLANGVPDTKDLNHFDDSLSDLSDSEGGRALLFGVAQGFQANGKNDSFGDLKDEMRDAALALSPGDVISPVDPNDPDAIGKAELKLAEAKSIIGGLGGEDPNDLYASCLQSQMDALKNNPAAKQEVAQSQIANIEDLAQSSVLTGWRLSTALNAAQAAGGGELQKIAADYANKLGATRVDLRDVAQSVSPEAAKELAFAFAKVGNADMASTFAARAADMLNGVAGKAKDANDKVAELQGTLDKELAAVGPALTNQQRHDYEAKFWDKNKDAIEEQKSANAALQGALNTDLPGLKQLAAINPDAAKSVSSCLQELARDPDQAQYVQDTVSGLREANRAFPAGFKDAEKDLVKADATATNTLANKALAAGDAEGAAEQLNKLHEFLENTTFATKDVRELVTQSLPELKRFAAVVTDAVKSHDLSKISAFLKDKGRVDALNEASKAGGELGSIVGNITKAVGVAAFLTEAASSTDGKQQVLDVLNAGTSSAELLSSGFKAFSEATKDATNQVLKNGGEALGQLSEVLEKVTPVLNLGISVLQDAMAIGDAINNPSVKTVGAAVGDTLTAVGAGIALLPGGELIGGGLAILGGAVSIISNFAQGIFDSNDRKDEEKELLKGVFADSAQDKTSPLYGLTQKQIDDASARLANTGVNLADLAKDAQLSPDQLVRLAIATPVMGESFFKPMNEIARLGGLKGQVFVDWVGKQDDLESKLLSWQTSGIEGNVQMSAGQQANDYAMSQNLRGQDFADAYRKKYQEIYDRDLSAMLKAQGLLP